MKKISLYIIVIFIQFVYFFTGCTNKSSSFDFSESRNLSVSKVLVNDEVYIKYPFRVRLDDSCLFLMDLHAVDFYIQRYAYPSFKFLGYMAKRGQGPNELLNAGNIRLDSNDDLWVLDTGSQKINKFFYNNDSSIAQDEISLCQDLVRTLDFALLNDSTFLVPDYTGKSRFKTVNKHGEIINSFYKIPVRENRETNIALAQAWNSFFDYNSKNGILALVTQLGEVVELYDLKNDSVISIAYGKNGEPEFKDESGFAVPTGIMGYSDVSVGKTNVYALFWGHPFDDVLKGKEPINGGNIIHVFDLKGNPVEKLILDRYITAFHIDEQARKIIALDVNSDQPVVEYNY